MRAVEGFMEDIKGKVDRIDDAIRGVKDRIEHSVSQLGVIGDAAKHVVKHFMEKKGKKAEKDEDLKKE